VYPDSSFDKCSLAAAKQPFAGIQSAETADIDRGSSNFSAMPPRKARASTDIDRVTDEKTSFAGAKAFESAGFPSRAAFNEACLVLNSRCAAGYHPLGAEIPRSPRKTQRAGKKTPARFGTLALFGAIRGGCRTLTIRSVGHRPDPVTRTTREATTTRLSAREAREPRDQPGVVARQLAFPRIYKRSTAGNHPSAEKKHCFVRVDEGFPRAHYASSAS
jgi:hypothetical protein